MNSIESPNHSTCVLVLGMHRSGTSALTRCLNLHGMDIGSHLLSPEKMNSKGFWEHADAVRINDDLLASFGMQWHSLAPLPEGWLASECAEKAREEIRALIKRDFTGVRLFGIKDPRMCRLAPLWEGVLREQGIRVVAVLMVRSPIEVAASLQRAHRVTIPHGVMLWLVHLVESEIASREMPRVLVDYDDLLSDPVGVLAHISQGLALSWPIAQEACLDAIGAFLDDGLRNHRKTTSVEGLPAIVVQVLDACHAIISNSSPGHWEQLAGLSRLAQTILAAVAYIDASHRLDERAGVAYEMIPQAALYFAHDGNAFAEERSTRKPVFAGRNQLDFAVPSFEGESLQFRLDPLNGRGAYVLHGLVLLDCLGRVIWDGKRQGGFDEAGILHVPSQVDPAERVAFTDEDPQINLRVPANGILGQPALLRIDLERLSVARLCEEVLSWRACHATVADQLESQTADATQMREELARAREQLAHERKRLQDSLAELTSQQQSSLNALESARKEIDRVNASQLTLARELSTIRASTIWRAFVSVRTVLAHLPPGARLQLRRALKAAWWALTPWRIPARVRFLRQRREAAQISATSSPAGPAVLSYSPAKPQDPNSGEGSPERGRYMLAEGTRAYTYVPPRAPADLDARLNSMRLRPLFSIVVPVYNTPPGLLNELVRSVLEQWYPDWQLILVNDNSSLPYVMADLDRLTDPRISVVHLTENKRIALATNEGIAHASGDYVVFADHDDELTPDCLFELALCVDRESPDFIYSDEDKIDPSGRYVEPFFKPDWSPDTLMSTMYTCHVSCVKRDLVLEVGGLRPEYDGSQDWDFTLRVVEKTARIAHIPKVLYHWRIIPASVASDLMAKPYAVSAGKRAREDAMARRGIEGELEAVEELPGYFRAVYKLHGEPLVSIVIPSKNNHKVLAQCLDSIESKSSYRNFEMVVIDNGSTDSDTLAYLRELRLRPRVKLLSYDRPFNYSAINNLGASLAEGELLVFLNDDTEIVSPNWLQRMGGCAQLRHVGAVGAKLLYPGGQFVQHAGVVNLANGPGHAFLRARENQSCYYARSLLEYNWIAVTGACLLVEKEKFVSIQGFDETLPIAYNDIDLCMKLIKAGYYNVVCQDVRLVHHESFSRGSDTEDPAKAARLKRDKEALYQKHPEFFLRDPFHNPNLAPNDVWFNLP